MKKGCRGRKQRDKAETGAGAHALMSNKAVLAAPVVVCGVLASPRQPSALKGYFNVLSKKNT